MAKKKSTETAEATAPEVTTVETPVQEVSEASTAEANQPEPTEVKTETETNVETEATSHEEETATKQAPAEVAPEPVTPVIPDKALAYLRRHPEDKEVYIDKFGGVFPVSIPKVFVTDAVLYQNPFYKQ